MRQGLGGGCCFFPPAPTFPQRKQYKLWARLLRLYPVYGHVTSGFLFLSSELQFLIYRSRGTVMESTCQSESCQEAGCPRSLSEGDGAA